MRKTRIIRKTRITRITRIARITRITRITRIPRITSNGTRITCKNISLTFIAKSLSLCPLRKAVRFANSSGSTCKSGFIQRSGQSEDEVKLILVFDYMILLH